MLSAIIFILPRQFHTSDVIGLRFRTSRLRTYLLQPSSSRLDDLIFWMTVRARQ